MGIEGLALMFGPTGLGLFTQEKAEALANEIASSSLTAISPVLGLSLPLFSALTDSGPVTNPLFRAANDNAAPANVEEAVDGIVKNLDTAQDLIDQEKWDDAFAVLDGVRKTYFADLPKAQRDAFFEDSKRYSILMGESRRMQALVLRQQGKAEQAQKIVDTALVFFRPEFMEHLPENSPEQAEAFLVRGKLYDLAGDPAAAKADFEAAAKINPAYQAQVDDYQKAMIHYAEEGEKMTVEEAKLAAKDGLIPTDRLDPETSLYVTVDGNELTFTDAFDKLPKEEKVVVFQSLFRIARVEKMRQGLDEETDPVKQLYMESQIALTDGNFPLAQLKMVAFKNEAKGNEDPGIVAMRNQVRRQLQAMSLGAIVRLEERNEAIIAQRRNNPEMLLSSAESHYRYNKNYLENLKGLIKSGRYDTIEDAQEGFKFLARKQDQVFRDNHIVGSTMNAAYLPYKAPQALSDEDLAAKKSDREVMNAYFLPNGEIDPKLFDPEAFPETAYVRLEGGTLKTPVPGMMTQYPGIVRVVVGKEGGEIFTMDRKRISFPASEREKIVLIRSGNLEANYRHVERHKDYFEEPIPFVALGFEDNDFDTLLKLETSEGWEKMQTPEARREHLLGIAEELRARNGSYAEAGGILEELLAPALEAALDEIPEDEKKKAVEEVQGEREKTKSDVNEQLEELKMSQPGVWKVRFPEGEPTDQEIESMVDLAQQEKIRCKLKRLAFEKVEESYDNGTLTDPTSRKAWDIYNDMKDPLDEFWNLSDESWDRITDEVVVTVVTLPLTMGAGKLAEIGIQGAAWVGRLARMGRMGFIASRAVTMTGVAATEGFVQQAANPVTVLQILHDANDPSAPAAFRMDEQLKSFGWGMVTSFAFHGGGSLWKRGSTALEIKNPLLNLGGTLTTQTLIASGLGELEPLLFDGEAPGTFFERMGGHAMRMVGRHYGTQAFHLATGGQFRQVEPKIVKVETADVGPRPDLSLARQTPKAKAIPTSGTEDVVTALKAKGILEPSFKMAEGQDVIDIPNPDGAPISLKFTPITPESPAYLEGAAFRKDLGVGTNETSTSFLEANFKPLLTPKEWSVVEEAFLSGDPKVSKSIRESVTKELGGEYKDLSSVSAALDKVLKSRGFDASVLHERLSRQYLDDQITAEQCEAGMNALKAFSNVSDLSLLPDETPVYRTVLAKAIIQGKDRTEMAPNKFGMSFWGVGTEGEGVARTYGETLREPYVVLKTTLGELKATGGLNVDTTAMTGNAIEVQQGKLRVRVEVIESKTPGPSKPNEAAGKTLFPQDAAFAGIGPAAGIMADFFGMSPAVATILGAAGLFLPVLGMVYKRDRTVGDPIEAELFEAVRKNPDDAEALHVYADYLMGQGDLRGELIALQLGPQNDESRAKQTEIQKALIVDLENETGVRGYAQNLEKSELLRLASFDSQILEILKNRSYYQFEGGFLKSAELADTDAPSIKALLASRLGFKIQNLDLRSVATDDFRKILPDLANLKSLKIQFKNGSLLAEERHCMKKLAQILPSSSLTSLSLNDNDIGNEGFIALLAGLAGSNIETLEITSASIGDRGLRELIKILPQTKIKRLNLADNEITDRELVALVRILPGTSVEEVQTDAGMYRVVENKDGVRFVEFDDVE